MIKIKISYERPEELQEVLKRLAPNVKSLKGALSLTETANCS